MKKIIFLIIGLFAVISSFNVNAQCISQDEFDALIALYNSTGGDNWTNNSGWDVNASACDVTNDWYGITIEGGEVTYLYLQNNNLTGSIPPEIGNLTGLIRFYLYGNNLSGSIPPEIGLLSNLDYLRLESNQLSGSIPSEIGTLSVLRVLQLSNNNLSGEIPIEFYSLTELTGVQMYNNSLSGGISPLIGNLSNLRSLYLYGNQLTGPIPAEIGNLNVLLYLFLNGNQLSGSIPSEIGNLSSLQSLSLQRNNFTGELPASIGNLSNLALLKIGGNQLTGTIHESIFGLTHMTNFQVNDNQFSGNISANIASMSNLQYLYLNGNQFSGDFPSVNGLNNLVRVRLNDNQFENLPTFSGLTSLILDAENNYLTFEDIEPNQVISNFTYKPQGEAGEEITCNVIKGNSYTMSVTVGGTANTYQWYKDGVEIAGATSDSYTIDNFIETDVATYHCEIKSNIITDLTLKSKDINLGITVGLITIDASENTESNTCTVSGVVLTTDFQTNASYSFAPETIPGTAQLLINSATLPTKRIQFNIDNNYNITDVNIEVGGNYVPLYNGFYTVTKIEENLHSTLRINLLKEICVYYPN